MINLQKCLNDRVRLKAGLVAVVEHLAFVGLGVNAQIAHAERLEEHSERRGVGEQRSRVGPQSRSRYRRAGEMPCGRFRNARLRAKRLIGKQMQVNVKVPLQISGDNHLPSSSLMVKAENVNGVFGFAIFVNDEERPHDKLANRVPVGLNNRFG